MSETPQNETASEIPKDIRQKLLECIAALNNAPMEARIGGGQVRIDLHLTVRFDPGPTPPPNAMPPPSAPQTDAKGKRKASVQFVDDGPDGQPEIKKPRDSADILASRLMLASMPTFLQDNLPKIDLNGMNGVNFSTTSVPINAVNDKRISPHMLALGVQELLIKASGGDPAQPVTKLCSKAEIINSIKLHGAGCHALVGCFFEAYLIKKLPVGMLFAMMNDAYFGKHSEGGLDLFREQHPVLVEAYREKCCDLAGKLFRAESKKAQAIKDLAEYFKFAFTPGSHVPFFSDYYVLAQLSLNKHLPKYAVDQKKQ